MSLRLPKGAYPIHQARLSGKKPADMVLISTVGSLPSEANPVVEIAEDDDPRQYDWRWSTGLQVAVVFAERTRLTARVIADQVLNSVSSQVYLWRSDLQKGWVAMRVSGGIQLFRFMAGETREFRGLGQ